MTARDAINDQLIPGNKIHQKHYFSKGIGEITGILPVSEMLAVIAVLM